MMLGRVYIKDKEIHLIYDGNIITNRSGCIYDIGHHLTGFTWFDMEFIKTEYVKFINFLIYHFFSTKNPQVNTIVQDINIYADSLDQVSPYLHFYTQALYDFLLAYIKHKADAFHSLVYVATDCLEEIDTISSEVAHACEMSFIRAGGLRNRQKHYECNTIEDAKEGAHLALAIVMLDIEKKRTRLVEEFDFISDELHNSQNFSAMQSLFLIDLKRKSMGKEAYYTDKPFKSAFLPTSPALWKDFDLERVKISFLHKKIEIVQMYDVIILDDLLRFELFHIITEQLLFKKCKYCGHYFVPMGRSDIEYCYRIYTGETKPCNQIGAMKVYENSKVNDQIYTAYKKSYRRMHSRTRTNKLSKKDFLDWSEQATKKRDECYAGIITFEEFMEWLR